MLSSKDLTRGEKLYLSRKRKNFTQVQMSVDLGVGLNEYRAMESDEPETKPPYITLGPLLEREVYIIMGRRSGMSRDELSEDIGVSTYWLRQMESGEEPLKRLQEYWGDQT